jgi:hypothetical protein
MAPVPGSFKSDELLVAPTKHNGIRVATPQRPTTPTTKGGFY